MISVNHLKWLTSIAGVFIGSLIVNVHPSYSSGQWPKDSFWPARAVTVDVRKKLPSFPNSVQGYNYFPGYDFWNRPIRERGQIRTFGTKEWQSINDFPNTMNGCHNGGFLMRWRSSNGPVYSAVGTRFGADFKASGASEFGYLYGTNCLKPLFKSIERNLINNVMYEIRFFQAGV